MVNSDSSEVRKALIHWVIEDTLFEISDTTVEEVGNRLYERYQCYFSDCLKHPDYLRDILKEIFGNASTQIICTINEKLKEFSDNKEISNFLVQISE